MSDEVTQIHLIKRAGTSQKDRLLKALDPSYFQVFEDTLEDLYTFAQDYAKMLHYFSSENQQAGNWEAFLNLKTSEIKSLFQTYTTSNQNLVSEIGSIQPHLGLFLTFLKLLQETHGAINELSHRHLDFYYKLALKAKPLPSIPDQVHLLVKLVEDRQDLLIPSGTLVKAGKDQDGNPIHYRVDTDLVANQTQVEKVMSLFVQKNEKEDWKLFRSEYSTQLQAVPSSPRWKLFGSGFNDNYAPDALQEVSFGWGFCSPSLYLSEGERTIQLDLRFNRPNPLPALENSVRIELTTEKKWVEVQGSIDRIEGSTLRINISIPKGVKAITTLKKERKHLPYPCLRLTPKAGHLAAFYRAFKNGTLVNVDLDIAVKGLQSLDIQTSEGRQKPKKPFAPFGSSPLVGDELLLNHTELQTPHLQTVNLHLHWNNLPEEGLGQYYQYYHENGISLGIPPIEQSSFTGTLSIFSGKERIILEEGKEHEIFPKVEKRAVELSFQIEESKVEECGITGTEKILKLQSLDGLIKNLKTNATQEVEEADIDLSADELKEREACIALRLTPVDFQHHRFARLTATQAKNQNELLLKEQEKQVYLTHRILKGEMPTVSMPENLAKLHPAEFAVLSPPFSPILKNISLDYTLKLSIDCSKENYDIPSFCFHKEPFGIHILTATNKKSQIDEKLGLDFLPNLEDEGNCFIGLKGFKPPQDLSLLFQLSEGTANPDLIPGDPKWSYLSKGHWQPILSVLKGETGQAHIITDTTQGLTSSGIIRLFIPEDATEAIHRMPKDLFWLRIQVDQEVDSRDDGISVRAQALSATWVATEGSSSHLLEPLAPEIISEPVEALQGLETFAQPFNSFGGRARESDRLFYSRYSERLRHKSRALTLWDYERLVLTQFPDVNIAKAFPGDAEGNFVPGMVTVMVVPKVAQSNHYDPLEPRMSVFRIREIGKYLSAIATAFAEIQVINPKFRYLKLETNIRFQDMNVFGFYQRKLQEDLNAYINPWKANEGQQMSFSREVKFIDIIDFIEHRPYVDYLEDPSVRLLVRTQNGQLEEDPEHRGQVNNFDIKRPNVVLVGSPIHTIRPVPR